MFLSLMRKELLIELRSKQILVSMTAFGLSVVLVFAFSFSVSPSVMAIFTPGLFWVLVLFIAVLGLHRLFNYEKEFDAFSLMVSAPIDRGLVYLSKWISGWIYMVIAEIIIVPLFILFLGIDIQVAGWTGIGIVLLGNAGIMAVGTLVSGLAMRARMSEVLLPVLLFPLVTPVLIAATKATDGYLKALPTPQWQFWILIMATFTVIFTALGYLLFDHIVEE